MGYWGSGPLQNDYAFDGVGAYVFLIKERMFQDAENVIAKSYPEQAIIASLTCIRLLASQFPECVSVHFGNSELQQAMDAFARWYEKVKAKLPPKYREAIKLNAEAEFQKFKAQVVEGRNS